MSLVTPDEISSLAKLARLRLDDDEVASLQGELSGILEHMELLSEVDTSGVEPMTHVTRQVQALRPDKVFKSLSRERVLAASARTEQSCFAVPAILPSGDSE